MAIAVPLWIQSETYQAADERYGDTAFMGAPSSTLARPSGVVPGYGGNLNVTASGLTINIATGAALIASASGAGSYRIVNTAPASVAVGAGSPTPRVDLIIARVYDPKGGEPAAGKFEVVVGGSTAPPMPAEGNAVKLAEVTVTDTGATVGLVRSWTTGLGGILPVTSGTRPAATYEGFTVFETDTLNLATYSTAGGGWRTVPTGSAGAWTPYTPTWITSVANKQPVLGNSTLSGRYAKSGRTVSFTINLNVVEGGGFGIGEGIYSFALPVAAASATARQLVSAHFYDASGGAGGAGPASSHHWIGNGLIMGGQQKVAEIRLTCCDPGSASKAGVWEHDIPFNVKVGDTMTVSGTYESGS